MLYKTIIGLVDDEQKEVLTKICSDIQEKDSTFKFLVLNCVNKKFKYRLVVESQSRDQAFQRGHWLIKKTGYPQLRYNVTEYPPKP